MASDPTKPDPAEEEHVFRPRIGRRRDSAPERAPNFRAQLARAIARQGGRKVVRDGPRRSAAISRCVPL
jgi:hypothetical protein